MANTEKVDNNTYGTYDLVIANGRVMAPASGLDAVRHAGIRDDELDAALARQHVDGGAAGEEVLHHLPGDVLRIGRDAGLCGAVVAGADEDVRRALRASGSARIEKNILDCSYWGTGPDGTGQNVLGKIWMGLRDEFFPKA